ncbi:hypothetical protein NC653_035030 [Populus alba x Populus x berolinensis]|uniref:Uncharacterized protein n=1 Tax=Populus alba x Populus x berolinensis TaxID=444605 RepID=A0AAD6LPA5_9ROSI|nr:hypothetical protein NC653_035030 [Populus alba x Populus x berolinensis]
MRSCELAKAAGAEDDAAVEARDGCVLVQDSEKNCLFGMLLDHGGENLVVIGRSQKERRRGRSFGFPAVRVIEGKCVFGFENGDGKGSVRLKVGGRERV